MRIDPRLNDIKDCLYRVAMKAIIIQNNAVLLVRDVRDTGWTLPGGGIDHGEKLQPALQRELMEELGLSDTEIQIDPTVIGAILGQTVSGVPRCNIHMNATITGTPTPSEEVESMKWASIDELNDLEYDATAGQKEELIALIQSVI